MFLHVATGNFTLLDVIGAAAPVDLYAQVPADGDRRFCADWSAGFYQEFLYRGLLQTDLVRRWGALSGILVSNLIFTFGPLHAYHFALARANPRHLWIFAATFSVGIFFAVLFKRSGNLWIVGGLHGLGDWFMDGLAQVSRMPH